MSYFGAAPTGNFISTASQRVTGSTNNYVDLDHAISALSDVIVLVNSVKQDITNLTFTSASRITLGDTLVSSDVVEIIYIGKSVATQTPGTSTVTNDMLAGSIANSKLANSSITLNGSAVSLGGSATVGGSNENSFMAYNNGSQLLNHATWTTIEYNAETFDLDSKFDTSTYRYTPASTGYYFLHAVVQFNFNDSSLGRRANLRLQKNGSDIAYAYQRFADSGFDALNVHSMSITWVDNSSSASDYYTVQAQQDNANGNNNCYAITGASSTYFTGYKLIT